MGQKNAWIFLAAAAVSTWSQGIAVNLTGTVTDSAGAPVSGAVLKLEYYGLNATSGADGKFTLTGTTGIKAALGAGLLAELGDGVINLSLPSRSVVALRVFGTRGEELAMVERRFDAGSHAMAVPATGTGLRFVSVSFGDQERWFKALSIQGSLRGSAVEGSGIPHPALSKGAAVALYDVISATKSGYEKGYVTVSTSDSSGIAIRLLKEENKFSFFIASMRGLQDLADTSAGFGGDLRFGERGPGAGLRGADKICATLAERSMKGSSVKGWRAFLSVSSDAYGKQVNAIERIGQGPWYDRVGRVLAPTLNDIKGVRPANGDPTIALDLPNEWGVPNHKPEAGLPAEDNHHMLTGSSTTGTLKGATSTCKDWTVSEGTTANGKPSHGYAWPRGGKVGQSGSNWMSTGDAPGCGAGIEIIENGPGTPGQTFVGTGGGYGGFYCFALNP